MHYRWRQLRTKRKAGNVADFCRRWGSAYRYLVVLDADSVMTGECLTALVRAIAARRVGRRYLAIAHGVPAQARFTIEAPIGRDPKVRTRMAVVAAGKPARTDVELLAAAGGMSLLRCTLHSGRTHQIRVHLASRGLPLAADRLYGGAAALGMERQALHAAELSFVHPLSGAELAFAAPPPADFAAAATQVTASGAA